MKRDEHPNNARGLVVVRAGDDSLHREWLAGAGDRNWDLLVSYFGDHPERLDASGAMIVCAKGPKYPPLKRLVRRYQEHIANYDYIWLPDDDLLCDTQTINRLFELCRLFGLVLAQPSLTLDSFVNHSITIHNPHYLFRCTNFVEIMAPCFERQALETCLDTFDESVFAWGLDLLWLSRLDSQADLIGIVDGAQVRHSRPTGGPIDGNDEERSPVDEMRQLLRKHRLEETPPVTLGAINLEGRRLQASEFAREIDWWFTEPW